MERCLCFDAPMCSSVRQLVSALGCRTFFPLGLLAVARPRIAMVAANTRVTARPSGRMTNGASARTRMLAWGFNEGRGTRPWFPTVVAQRRAGTRVVATSDWHFGRKRYVRPIGATGRWERSSTTSVFLELRVNAPAWFRAILAPFSLCSSVLYLVPLSCVSGLHVHE